MGGTGSVEVEPRQPHLPPVRRDGGRACASAAWTCANTTWRALRDAVAVVLQKNVLFSGTIYDNLRWGNENATDEQMPRGLPPGAARTNLSSASRTNTTPASSSGGTNVSGGQKQRLCIARALLKKPKVLILDDSTSAVDTATDAKIREAMRTHIPGTTKIIIAQRISSVQDADRVLVVMDNGRVNAFDTHGEPAEDQRDLPARSTTARPKRQRRLRRGRHEGRRLSMMGRNTKRRQARRRRTPARRFSASWPRSCGRYKLHCVAVVLCMHRQRRGQRLRHDVHAAPDRRLHHPDDRPARSGFRPDGGAPYSASRWCTSSARSARGCTIT